MSNRKIEIEGTFIYMTALLTEMHDGMYEQANAIDPVPEGMQEVLNTWRDEPTKWVFGTCAVDSMEYVSSYEAGHGVSRIYIKGEEGYTVHHSVFEITKAIVEARSNGNS